MAPHKLISRCFLGAAVICLLLCGLQFILADSAGISREAVYHVGSIFVWLGLSVVSYLISLVVFHLGPKTPPPLPQNLPKPGVRQPLTREQAEDIIAAAKPGAKPPPLDGPATYKLD